MKITPTGVWVFDEYLRQLSAGIRTLHGTDGRPRARGTARKRVLVALRRIRTLLDERAPAIIERKPVAAARGGVSVNKVELLATFRDTILDKRIMREAVFHVRMHSGRRIVCSCGRPGSTYVDDPATEVCVAPHSTTELPCSHIIDLFDGRVTNATFTAFGRAEFQWRWAQQALERST